jgi:glycosyltransferase involved in cell wall biosynthesis
MIGKSISLIVPAYKEQDTIVKQVEKLNNVLLKTTKAFEILVVVDGFLDKTYDVIKKENNRFKNLKVFGYEKNMGKGYAVKYGVEKASKEIIGFIDSGMDLDPEEIPLMLNTMIKNEADIVLGSKIHPKSSVIYPVPRKILSFGYQSIIHLLFGFKIKDTQVGLKFFKKQVAKNIFSKITTKRFAFDIEVFVIALKLGYKNIYEVPISLKFKQNTINIITLWKTIFWMLVDTVIVFYRLRFLNYYNFKIIQKNEN